MIRRAWAWLWRPRWAGTWTLARWTYAIAGALTHGPKARWIEDAYASSDVIFSRKPINIVDYVVFTPPSMFVVWALGMLGLGGLARGGRWARPGIVLFVISHWLMLGSEAVNTKGYDRLITWEALALLLGPISERDLTSKWRSPVGRWLMLIIFMAIYLANGLQKGLNEPHWRDGTALAYNLVDLNFGGTVLGSWLSGWPLACTVLGWGTLIFEIGFPFLILLRWTNPLILFVGIGFHLGIALTMHVGTFSWIALAAYPVLLSPETGERIWRRLEPHVRRVTRVFHR